MKKPNLGKDAPITTNASGGKQSDPCCAFHLLDAHAMMALANVTYEGAKKYARDNWRLISKEEHINHALTHLFAHLAGDRQDDHLEHALCRVMMALAKKLRPRYLGCAKYKKN